MLLFTRFLCIKDQYFQLYQHFVHFGLCLCTCWFPLRARVKEVSSDAKALGIRAEMKSRRCWEAALESGSGREPREPTKLEGVRGGENHWICLANFQCCNKVINVFLQVEDSNPCVSFSSLSLMMSISLSLASTAVEKPDAHRGTFTFTGAEIRPVGAEETHNDREKHSHNKKRELVNHAMLYCRTRRLTY